MFSTSSMSSVGSWKEICAARNRACNDSVGGPVGGAGEPFVKTKSLVERREERQLKRSQLRPVSMDLRSPCKIPPAHGLELLSQ